MKAGTILYFGSFNPIHCGHLSVAEAVLEKTQADALWFIVSPRNPFKDTNELAPETDRLAMVRLALQCTKQQERISVSDIEFELPRPSRTIHTLETLHRHYPDRKFTLLIGSDNVADFPKWERYGEILDKYPIYVYPRDGYPLLAEPWADRLIYLNDLPHLPQVATGIRAQLAAGQNPETALPATVWEYIKNHRLYGYVQ